MCIGIVIGQSSYTRILLLLLCVDRSVVLESVNQRSISPRVARTHRCARAKANNNADTHANTHVAHAALHRRRRRARRRVLPEWILLGLPLIVSRNCRRGTPSPPISHVITLSRARANARARVHVVAPSSQARFDRRKLTRARIVVVGSFERRKSRKFFACKIKVSSV